MISLDPKAIALGLLSVGLAVFVGWHIHWGYGILVLAAGLIGAVALALMSLKRQIKELVWKAKNPTQSINTRTAVELLPFWARPFVSIVIKKIQSRIAAEKHYEQ